MTITALPIPPSRQDPTNFSERADAFMAALPAFATETNATAVDVDADAVSAAASAVNAAASAAGANASANVSKWVSGTTYAEGDVEWSPVNFFSYRRKVAGAGTTDPSADSVNWALVSGAGDVSLTGTQTLTNKTLTSPIINSPTLTSPVLGTPLSGNLSNCTFPILNQNTTGNAATATLANNVSGVVALTNGGTGQTTALLAGSTLGVIGINQTWQSVVGSRAFNTNYSNTAGRPIVVTATTGIVGNYSMEVLIDGTKILSNVANFTTVTDQGSVYFIVPSGVTYRINCGSVLSTWFELR